MESIRNISDGRSSVSYTLTRSRRKTVGIRVTENGEVKVSAPLNISDKQLKDIMLKKLSWILKKQEELRKLYKESCIGNKFADGETFLYLGKEYTLKIVKVLLPQEVALEGSNIVIGIGGDKASGEGAEYIRSVLRDFYIRRFIDIVKDRMDLFSPRIGVSPKKVTVREQKTRWGSCSSKGNISLNWRLVMAPMEVIDYVIVHELCHMKEMNHSKNYWNLVKSILPDFDLSRKWLKVNGHRLVI
ncbi:M48 family metallopeptidase [Acetivibrio straminisolvens]|uniref:Metal-dependent hydrolase n=1 Tax=Acetivibrio straminisolvens JCM 21531 TaxID=1294263 RepID=W4VD86_9FIRM|nr:SprT family zinc-dependent metalloprotease [Acetivibrio straminisolvens]GAE90719.1 metal-dependent hydrolase [Acetivibrio straminisolvens JCM 21531]